MADQKKRIIDLSELSQEVQEGQYILVDSAGGTGKMNLKKSWMTARQASPSVSPT